jgi:hypothetical protein
MDDALPGYESFQKIFRGVSGEPLHLGAREGERPVPKAPVDDPGHVVHEGEEPSGKLLLIPKPLGMPNGNRDLPRDRFRRIDLVLRPFVRFRPVEEQYPDQLFLVAKGNTEKGPEAYRLEPLSPPRIDTAPDIVDDVGTAAPVRLPRNGVIQQGEERRGGGRDSRLTMLQRLAGESGKEDRAPGDSQETTQVTRRFGNHRPNIEVAQKGHTDPGQKRKTPGLLKGAHLRVMGRGDV